MFRNKSVNQHNFAMVPRSEVPRSTFPLSTGHKTSFDSGWLVPMYVDEVLPGDSFNINHTIFARLATPIFPFMDNLFIDTFYFYVPNRLLWDNWQKFMGEQRNPGDSIDYTVPAMTCTPDGYTVGEIFDYMGLPTEGQIPAGAVFSHNSLHLRAYNMIWNEFFRDENLQNRVVEHKGDSADPASDYRLLKRGKRKDYFTSCLPWTQKGSPVALPLSGNVPVKTGSPAHNTSGWAPMAFKTTSNTYLSSLQDLVMGADDSLHNGSATGLAQGAQTLVPSNLYADLSAATAATINQLRQAFQIQRLLEKDARGGTRYQELLKQHFGVWGPDARLQRPEYLGGGSTPIAINPVAQTQASPGSGAPYDTPQGNLAAFGTVVARNGFRQSFVEHGVIIGLMSVRADMNYQQGMRRMWRRQTRYDFYWPVFQALGEQAVLNREIYVTGSATDEEVFGYQERWAEYRYHPGMVTGLMRSTAAGTIDNWHLAQKFTALPTLNAQFIEESPPLQRVLAVGEAAGGQELIADIYFSGSKTRPLPVYSVPGMIDHF